jgi:hypothetical protein
MEIYDNFMALVVERYPGRSDEVRRWADEWYNVVQFPAPPADLPLMSWRPPSRERIMQVEAIMRVLMPCRRTDGTSSVREAPLGALNNLRK